MNTEYNNQVATVKSVFPKAIRGKDGAKKFLVNVDMSVENYGDKQFTLWHNPELSELKPDGSPNGTWKMLKGLGWNPERDTNVLKWLCETAKPGEKFVVTLGYDDYSKEPEEIKYLSPFFDLSELD